MVLNLANKFEEYINQKYIGDSFFEKFSSINASEVLKELKKESYDNEFELWKQSYEKDLLSIKSSKDNFNELVKVIKKNKIVPFIGSGLSVASGYKIWASYLIELAKEISKESEVLIFLKKAQYEEVAEFLSEQLGKENFNSKIDFKFAENSKKPIGIINILPRITNGTIVTTNFDKLIEKVFSNHGKMLTIVHGNEDKEFHRSFAKGDDYLLKLHGSVNDTNSRIFTKSEYESAYLDYSGNIDFQKPLPENLSKIYKNATLLFLGCSLENDRTMQLFKSIMEQEDERKIPRHYAFLSSPEKLEDLIEKEKFLTEHMIFPIWYPKGEYEILDNMIELLLYEVENE